ncbi:MAG: hypothetical protein HYX86_01770 [Chloroflexi bacterium]|nr:hypothetical protein [Chloroflexota bacterium]
MGFRDIFQILRRRVGAILFLALLTPLSAMLWGNAQLPVYRSTTLLQVIPARPDYGLTLAAEQLLRQFALQIETPARAQEIVAEEELDIPVEDFLAMVTAAARPEEFLLEISVDHPDSGVSQQIANALAQNFVEEHNARSLEQDRQVRVGIEILEPAEPGELLWPKMYILGLSGVFFGLVLGAIIAFALEFISGGAINTPQEVERSLGVSVLGGIPRS